MSRRVVTLLWVLGLVCGLVGLAPIAHYAKPTTAASTRRLFMPLISRSDGLTRVRFALKANGQDVVCGQSYNLGSATTPITITDARFYVSNLRLLTAQGSEVPLQLRQDGEWQREDLALLDFESGTNGCIGDARLNSEIVGQAPDGVYTGLRFDLGVPFAQNHLDVATAPAPLNIPALWWNWQTGYKFVRIDLKTPPVVTGTQTLTDWFIHLGSTNCPSPDGVTPPTGPCARPNRATITLNNFNPSSDVVVADLAGLLTGVNLSQNTPAPPGCMSGANDPDCQNLFPNFGLDVASGSCNNTCADQKLFRLDTSSPAER